MDAAANIDYTYDAAGHLTQIDYGNGSVISYTYDNAGNLITRSVATTLTAQTISFAALPNLPLARRSLHGQRDRDLRLDGEL